jgi:hypothetical protein
MDDATAKRRRGHRPGDRITVQGRRAERSGEIVEVDRSGGREHYLVRWDDGKVSGFYPAIEPKPKRSRKPEQRPSRVTAAAPVLRASPGDRLVVHGHHLGQPGRDAEILEVKGPDGTPPYVVRWADTGRVGVLYPGSDASVEHFARAPG